MFLSSFLRGLTAQRCSPKRNAAGSIPVMDASKQRCKPLFSRVYSFFCYHGQGSKCMAAYVRGNFQKSFILQDSLRTIYRLRFKDI